jgi:hypothetical protein
LRDLGEEKEVKRREDEGLEHLGAFLRRRRAHKGEGISHLSKEGARLEEKGASMERGALIQARGAF